MSNTNSSNVPGLLLPTQTGMAAGNPRDSAIANQNAGILKLEGLQKIGGNRRKYKKRGGSVVVPQFPSTYKAAGGPGQTPNSIIQQNAAVGTQSAENSKNDGHAILKGGHYNMNTNTNQYQWGCYSGGKKHKRNRGKMSLKKSRKINKSRKLKYSRKSRKSRYSK